MARELLVRIIGDDASLHRSFARSSKAAQNFDRDLARSARGAIAATVSFRGLGRAIAFGSTSFLAGVGVTGLAKQVISQSAQVQEELEKTGVLFGRNAQDVAAWSRTLAESFGVSTTEALKAAGTFGGMLRPLGFAQQAAALMSKRLVELAADMASFNNVKPDVILQALSSGLAGQVRPLRQYGVFLSQARIQTEAYADGIAKTGSKLTAAQKVQASYNIILKDTKLQQGDVARNTESLSVATSKLAAGFHNLEAGLGGALLPSLTAYVNKAAEWLNQTQNQQRVQRDFTEALDGLKTVLTGTATVIKTIDKVTGSFANTLKLLVGLKIASVVGGWATDLARFAKAEQAVNEAAVVSRIRQYTDGVSTAGTVAAGSAGKVNLLRGALLRLGAIGAITIGIEVLLNKDKIDRAVTGFLRGKGLGFLTGKQINLPADITAAQVKQMSKELQKAGADPLVLEALKKLAKKLATTEANAVADQVKDFFAKTTKFTNLGPSLDLLNPANDLGTGTAGAGSRKRLNASQLNQFFDNSIARILLRGGFGTIQNQINALQKANGLIEARIAATKDVTRRLNLEDELLQNTAKIRDLQQQQAADALQKSQDAFTEIIAGLQLGVTKAQATGTFRDDLVALKALQAGIQQEIREFGRTADLQGQLFDVQQQIKNTVQQQRSAAQFAVLGLGPTGEARIPLVSTLKRELADIIAAVSGTSLDTSKLKREFVNIGKVLSEAVVPPDVRSKIRDMLADVQSQLQNHTRNLTRFAHTNSNAILAGLGLDRDTARIIQQRLSQVGVGGTIPGSRSLAFSGAGTQTTVIPLTVTLDGQTVSKVVTTHQRKANMRRTDSRRGPYAGRH